MFMNKRTFRIFSISILSMMIMLITTFSNSTIAKAAPVSGQTVVDEARKYLGKPYSWGATGPNSFDCSGFTQYVYKNSANIDIGRTTFNQINSGREISQSDLKPGDLIFTNPGHVAIFIGNGQMIHSPKTGDVVKVSSIYSFWRARRII